MRFYWFLLEIQDFLWHYSKEKSIINEPGFFDLCPGEREKKLKPVYDTWRGDWFSDKSFNRWCKICKDTSPKPKYSKEKEQEEDKKEKELMDMDRKYKEQDAVHLKEKCPTCKDQCERYMKQLHEILK